MKVALLDIREEAAKEAAAEIGGATLAKGEYVLQLVPKEGITAAALSTNDVVLVLDTAPVLEETCPVEVEVETCPVEELIWPDDEVVDELIWPEDEVVEVELSMSISIISV